MRHIYKFLALFVLFAGSLALFGRHIPDVAVTTSTATVLQSSTFPNVVLQLDDRELNPLRGYSTELKAGTVRESITPVDTSKNFNILISQNETSIKKMDVALYDISDNSVIFTDSITVFDEDRDVLRAPVTLDTVMKTSTEYSLRLTLTNSLGKKINYYTRIKYYEDDFFLDKKLAFINDFHNATFGKSDTDISKYLEYSSSEKNDDLSDVTIKSSSDLVKWNGLSPKQITEAQVTVKELNIETIAAELDYYVTLGKKGSKETCSVKEFYRLRYSDGQFFLLNFRRTLDTIFNPDSLSLSDNSFKIGITKDTVSLSHDSESRYLAFVRNGSLWSYDLKKNSLDKVFSFEQEKNDYIKNEFDQHDIQVINISKNGDIDFAVTGYMNSGDYEGRVAVILYHFNLEKNELEEKVYIPLSTTFDRLRLDFGSFCYVNRKNTFYFSVNNTAYSYNITSKKYEILTKSSDPDDFAMIKSSKTFVIGEKSKGDSYSRSIRIIDLKNGTSSYVRSEDGDIIRILGTVDKNLIYGLVHEKDIYESADGETVEPVYNMIIADNTGKTIRSYENPDLYVSDIEIKNDIIHMNRMKKTSSGKFKKTKSDSMMTENVSEESKFSVTSIQNKNTLKEKYIALPDSLDLKEKPSIKNTNKILISENTTFYMNKLFTQECYYVYAYGTITDKFSSAGKSIETADEEMGTVTDYAGRLIWERGGRFTSRQLAGYTDIKTGSGINSAQACAALLLKGAQVSVEPSDLTEKSILGMIKDNYDSPANLTGCNVDEVLYFVSSEKPVIAQYDSDHFVMIIAYTSEKITIYDPDTGKTSDIKLSQADHIFSSQGNVFISYI